MQLVCERRGWTPQLLASIDIPDEAELDGMNEMCAALYALRKSTSRIVVLPDFDADGIMSGIIGYSGLADLGFTVSLYTPETDRGYGFGEEEIDEIVHLWPDTRAIITCDVGISAHAGIARAKELGLKVLVTDHHMQRESDLLHEQADVIVDPCKVGETYPLPGICGAYVMWKVLDAYAKRYATSFEREQIRRLRVFAGIGTVTDSMPLIRENRELVRDSIAITRLVWSNGDDFFLKGIENRSSLPYKQAFSGLHRLIDAFHEHNKVKDVNAIDEGFYGFSLGPSFNAVRRLGRPSSEAFNAFFGSSDMSDAYVKNLFALNEQRKQDVALAMEELKAMDQPFVPYIYFANAGGGLLGLLAGNLLRETGLPAIVLVRASGNAYAGSGRSPAWFPMLTKVAEAGDFDMRGHQGAFGVRCASLAEVEALYHFISRIVPAAKREAEATGLIEEPWDYKISTLSDPDADFGIDIPLFAEFAQEIQRLKPFGKGFEEPRGRLEFKGSDAEWRVIGGNSQHLKAVLPRGLQVLMWNQAPLIDEVRSASKVAVDGTLGLNEFANRTTVQFVGDIVGRR